jgi:hypothetical protein
MSTAVYIGIATTSHNAGVIGEARFDHVNIATSLPVITSASSVHGIVTLPLTDSIAAIHIPYQFNATGLPDSLRIDKETGIISGTPAIAGTFPVIVSATNALGTGTDTLTIVIAKKTQSISFNALADKKLGDRDFQLNASATSALAVTYSSSDTTVAKVANGIVHIVKEGIASITALQVGNDFYEPAINVSRNLVIIKLPHNPYGGTARVVPGVVEAEDFDTGGEGKAYHESTAWNLGLLYRWNEGVDIELCKAGGYDVFLTAAGEWMKYTIDVQEDGDYQLSMYLADLLGTGKMRVEIDGVNKTGTIAAGKTGGLQKWKTITKAIHLTAGLRVVTIFFEAGGMSVNKLVFTKAASSAAVRDGSDDLEIEDSSLEVSMYPNPVEDYLQLVVSKEFIGGEAALIDNRGVKITAMPVRSNTLAVDMSSFTSGLYVLRIDNGKRMITRKVIKK